MNNLLKKMKLFAFFFGGGGGGAVRRKIFIGREMSIYSIFFQAKLRTNRNCKLH